MILTVTLRALGDDVVLTGFAGTAVRAELRTAGLRDEFVETAGRRTVTVVDGVGATDWPTRLRDAVALSAATVLAPVAGEFDRAAYERFRPAVIVEEI